jgi:hypothetical protein
LFRKTENLPSLYFLPNNDEKVELKRKELEEMKLRNLERDKVVKRSKSRSRSKGIEEKI